LGALAAGAALSSPALAAGTVDYGAFEELFQEPVTMSATGAPQRVTEVPVGMHILTQEDIRRSGAVDLPGVLEQLPVLDVDRRSRGQADVAVRGYNTPKSPRLLVLLNGRQVYLDHFGMTNWDLIPVQMSEIRQIEVVTGPNTALFGFNAVAGVINIITFDALNDDADAVDVTVGSKEFLGASAVITHKLLDGDLGVRVGVGGFNADSFSQDLSSDILPVDIPSLDPLRRSASIGLAYKLTPKVRMDLDGSWSQNERAEVFPFASFVNTIYEATSIRLGLTADTKLGLVETSVYSNGLDADYILGPLEAREPRFIFENRITVANSALILKPGTDHVVRLAAEYRRNSLQQFPFRNGRQTYNVYALSGSWTWQATNTLSVTSAVRVDHLRLGRTGEIELGIPVFSNADFNQTFTEPSFNAGLVWRPTSKDTFRLTGARGVQSPSLITYGIEFFNSNPLAPFGIYGSPDVEPTIVYDAQFGWDRDIPALHARLRFSAFWQRNLDIISQAGSTPEFFPAFFPGVQALISGSVGRSDVLGGDVQLEGDIGPFDWRLGYGYRNLNDSLLPPALGGYNDSEFTTPGSIATGGIGYRRGPWQLDVNARYVGEQGDFFFDTFGGQVFFLPVPVGDYTSLNTRIAYEVLPGVTAAVSGRNLANDSKRQATYSAIERAVYFTLSANF